MAGQGFGGIPEKMPGKSVRGESSDFKYRRADALASAQGTSSRASQFPAGFKFESAAFTPARVNPQTFPAASERLPNMFEMIAYLFFPDTDRP
jgi:hypothetical protein